MAKTKTTREMTEDGADANRFHQALGARWMVEAIVRECRTVYRLNRNAQQFANDLEGRWQDEAFWRPAPSESGSLKRDDGQSSKDSLKP